ncbi:MAG: alpha/beta hydrolase [Candidatus Binatia bacterium]|nr:alpha/beta hydrolase [Candidatus Binatia bacterium]
MTSSLAWLLAPAVLTAGFSLPLVDRLVFFPDRAMPDTPAGVEDRWITTEDGIRIHAWYLAAPEPDAPTVLWAHGNGGNIGGRYEVQATLARRGLNVLAYDYRGYGRSEGSPSEAGAYLDSHAVFDSLTASGVPASEIVCLGESLGGAVTIELAMARPCAGVAVVSTFTTIADVARSHYGPLAFLAAGIFDSKARVGGLRVPYFGAHGDRDEIVDFALGEALFVAAPEPKEFLRIDGAGHNDIFQYPQVADGIAAFARRVSHIAREEPSP